MKILRRREGVHDKAHNHVIPIAVLLFSKLIDFTQNPYWEAEAYLDSFFFLDFTHTASMAWRGKKVNYL